MSKTRKIEVRHGDYVRVWSSSESSVVAMELYDSRVGGERVAMTPDQAQAVAAALQAAVEEVKRG